jgi:UPF0755 protein
MEKLRVKRSTQLGLMISIGVLALVGVGASLWVDHALAPVRAVPAFSVVYVPPGYRATQIADLLAKRGLIRSRFTFIVWTKITGKESHLWAGYYNISGHFSVPFIVKVLTEHTIYSRLVRVTIPEGYSLQQIGDVLEKQELVNATEFVQYVRNDAKLELLAQFPWMVMIPTHNLEGVLYPDTYMFPPSATDRMIVKVLLSAFSRQVLPVWNTASQNATLNFYNTLTLASMIEKEAVLQDEMPIISGVFHNRLAINMPLASDPTVVYALGLAWKQTVLYRDLKVESPYNTYRNRGLPPTPIASPGIAAFKAALAPRDVDYLFFVATPSHDGRHIFTRTYREHLAAQK